jgi:hypothetical protein
MGNGASCEGLPVLRKTYYLSIEYNVEDVPDGGKVVVSSQAACVKATNKEAAGHLFHLFALRQAGIYSKLFVSLSLGCSACLLRLPESMRR